MDFPPTSSQGLSLIHQAIASCRMCPKMVGPPVHGAAIVTPIFLIGQAPGPREGKLGRPFAYTAGKTLFRWFEEISGIQEEEFRRKVYMAAVARCFPGKGKGAGDRVPDSEEISNCSQHLRRELGVLRPKLIIAVGKLAIQQVLGRTLFDSKSKLSDVIGKKFRVTFLDHESEVICLPHPSGLSAWHKVEPGKSLLRKALLLIFNHDAWRETLGVK